MDWKARAEREAAAILDEVEASHRAFWTRDLLVSVIAVGWLQGYDVGAHQTLSDTEAAFERLRASL